MTYKIEDNIPISPHGNRNGATALLRAMEVGQSFFVPPEKIESVRGTYIRLARKTGRKFAVRMVDGGHRVWRIE